MKYKVVTSRRFDKQFSKMVRRQKDALKLWDIVKKLQNGEELPAKYRDHKLKDDGHFVGCRECHIEPDWLLVYVIRDKILELYLMETGTHSDLFGK